MKSFLGRKSKTVLTLAMILSLVIMTTASAGSATKTLSTNFTLVNLGLSTAVVDISYILPDGSPWTGSIYTSFNIDPDGGQAIVRQYDDALDPGRGSVVISSTEELGSMVQLLNKSGIGLPTSGAYSGFKSGSASVKLPLLSRKAQTGSGLSNSMLFIQNTGGTATSVTVSFFTLGSTSGTPIFVTPELPIAAGASYSYDLYDVLDANLPVGWWGSAVVSAATGGQVAVVVNWFLGTDGLNAYEGVPAETLASKWFIPLLYIRLPNTLSTSVSVQNVSGVTIPEGDITLNCKKDATSAGSETLSYSNTAEFPDKSVFAFNMADASKFPEGGWYGGCTVNSATAKNIVVLVQHRYVGGGSDTGAHIAIPATSTDKILYVPLVAKRLSNNFATTATIQNLDISEKATVTLTYTPSGGGTPIVRTGIEIPAGGSIIRNFRLYTTELPEITDGWVGTLKVTSDKPVQAYLANTFMTISGDQLMSYTGFTKP